MSRFKCNVIFIFSYGFILFMFKFLDNNYYKSLDTISSIEGINPKARVPSTMFSRTEKIISRHEISLKTDDIIQQVKEGQVTTRVKSNLDTNQKGQGGSINNRKNELNKDRNVSLVTKQGKWNVTIELQNAQILDYVQNTSFLQVKPIDILKQMPLKFIPTLKNPCVFVPSDRLHVQLKCLPRVFLFGTEKCGTSDLYYRLILHQHVHGPAIKEPQFFNSLPNIRKDVRYHHNGTIGGYNRLFASGINHIKTDCRSHLLALNKIHQNDSINYVTYPQCPHILLDATPRYFHNFMGVTSDPLNAGLQEPRSLVPHRIHHWLPDPKLILMLRNPTDRMLSAYRYFQRLRNQTSNAKHFHEYVVNGTKMLSHCLGFTSLKNCVYHFNTTTKLNVLPYFNSAAYSNLCIGIYHVLLNEWFAVFDKENFFIVKFEDYKQNVTDVFDRLLDFMDMEPLNNITNSNLLQWLDTGKVINKAKSGPDEMLPETRMLLDDLYRPHNALLYRLLKEHDHSWSSQGFNS